MENPFYYSDLDPTAEALASYAALVSAMARSGAAILWVQRTEAMVRFAGGLSLPHTAVAPALTSIAFPCFAPRGHNSAWGNELLAQQLAAYLVAGVERQATLPVAADLQWPAAPAGGEPVRLDELETLSLRLGELPVGVFTTTGTHDDTSGVGGASAFHQGPFSALLAVDTGDSSATSGAFVPLRFALREGAPVELVGDDGSGRRLDAVRMLGGRLPIGRIELPASRFHMKGEVLVDVARALPAASPSELHLRVAGRAVLRGAVRGGRAKLLPVAPDMLRRLSPLAGAHRPVDRLEPAAELTLVATTDSETLRAPLATLELRRTPLPPPNRELPRRLVIGPDGVGRMQAVPR